MAQSIHVAMVAKGCGYDRGGDSEQCCLRKKMMARKNPVTTTLYCP